MELAPRTTAPAHATGAVEFVPLSALAADTTFRLREEGDVSALAGSIVRLGQLVPVELRPLPGAGDGPVRYQVVAGFRRLAALKLLQRGRVLARVHQRLDEDDAWGLALVLALLGEPLGEAELGALRERLGTLRHVGWAEELVSEALVRAPVPPEQRERFLEFLSGAALPAAEPPDAEGAEEEAEPEAREEEAVAAPPAEQEEEASPEPGEDEPVEVTPEELAQDLAERLWALNQDLAMAWDAWDDLPEDGRRLILDQARYVAELFPLLSGGRK